MGPEHGARTCHNRSRWRTRATVRRARVAGEAVQDGAAEGGTGAAEAGARVLLLEGPGIRATQPRAYRGGHQILVMGPEQGARTCHNRSRRRTRATDRRARVAGEAVQDGAAEGGIGAATPGARVLLLEGPGIRATQPRAYRGGHQILVMGPEAGARACQDRSRWRTRATVRSAERRIIRCTR